MANPGSTSRSKTGYVAEVTPGTTPASPSIQNMRVKSSKVSYTPSRVTSDEIRADRQVPDNILTKFESGGDIDFELSFAGQDDFIQAALQGTWTNNPSITSGISALSTTTLTAGAGAGTPFKAGMLALFAGFTVAGDNGLFGPVSSSTSTTIVFPAATFTGETPPVGASVRAVGFAGASGDITANASGLLSTALDFTTLGINVGEWHKIGGDGAGNAFATAACNGWARVSAVAAHAITYTNLPAGFTTDAGTGKTIQVFFGDFITNGSTQRSFTIERQQQDLASPTYEYFTGMQVDKFSLPFKASSILAGTMSFVGQGQPNASTTRVSGATDVSAPTYPILNAASHIGELYVNGSPVSGPSYMSEIGLDIANNMQTQFAIGSIGPIGVLDGQFNVTGNFVSYFGDLTEMNLVINDTDTSMMFRAGRKDGNRESILFDVPSMRVSGNSTVDAKNQSRMFNGTYAAKMHATLNYMLGVGRFWYLPTTA